MKQIAQLSDDRFHAAAGARELPDDPWGARIGPVGPQRGLQIDADGRPLGLKKGAQVPLITHHQAPNALGQLPRRLAFIPRGGRHRASGDHPVDSNSQFELYAIQN